MTTLAVEAKIKRSKQRYGLAESSLSTKVN